MLYVANQSKSIYPYWKYILSDIRMFDDGQGFIDFRFGKNDLFTLLEVFNIPNRITTVQGTIFQDKAALCILLIKGLVYFKITLALQCSLESMYSKIPKFYHN